MAFGHLKVPDNCREHVLEVVSNTLPMASIFL